MPKPFHRRPSPDRRRDSPHFDGRRFRNPAEAPGRGFWGYMKWAASSKRRSWPVGIENTVSPQIPANLAFDSIAATFINHSTFLLQIGGLNLLTDPVYSERVGPWNLGGPKRTRAPGVPFENLPPIDCVLLSHNHYDHLDVATLKRLQKRFDPEFVISLGNESFLRRKGFQKVVELDWWESHTHQRRLHITLTPAQHFSSRHLFDRDRTLWGGFAVACGAQRIYFVGDSGYGEHFKLIGERLRPIDLALIPIGAYEPRWFMRHVHVNPDEAVQIHLDARPRLSIGMHFGTFQLTDEWIDHPVEALRDTLRRRGVGEDQFIVPAFGQTVVLPPKS